MAEYIDLAALAPEIFLGVMAPTFLLVGALQKSGTFRHLVWLGTAMAFVAFVLLAAAREGGGVPGHFSMMAALAMMAAMLPVDDYLSREDIRAPEYPALALFSLLGAVLMLRSHHLMQTATGCALLCLPMVPLAAMRRVRTRSFRAALGLYVAMGIACFCLLFGAMLLYGAAGGLDHAVLAGFAVPTPLMLAGACFVVSGLLAMMGAAFFHLWLPGVLDDAPWPVSLLMGLLLPAAAAGTLAILLAGPLEWAAPPLKTPLILLGGITIVFAGIASLGQTAIKRLMAFALMAQGGMALLAIASGDGKLAAVQMGLSLCAFAGGTSVMLELRREGRIVHDIAALAGLVRARPASAHALLLFFGSFAFLPPFPGFFSAFFTLRGLPGWGGAVLPFSGMALLSAGLLRAISIALSPGETAAAPFDDAGASGGRLLVLLCVAALTLFLLVPGVFFPK